MFSAGGGDSTKQLQRVESPDRFTDAVLIQTIPGFSIEPYGFDVYIKRTDKRGEKDKPILEGGGFKDLKLMWVAPRVLQISYSAGCIGLFRNNWLALDQDNRPYYQDGRPYRIEVRLKSPTDGEPHTCE